jgi:large subunit ribosomal protein L29
LDELAGKEKDLREELFNLRFQHATGQLENIMRIPQVRKDLARIKTVLREKAGEQNPENEVSEKK